ncbi:PE-PPE domain-containing protein [Mycolicibacterium rutilum]|uniref:PE-PPE domain-containing protein n=1 Tax=Mycolicibacterium rutilum TaxID=370526 RepID=A0A1H6LJE8_MYCRU|nr:PE-PPE domain-containing protein [Mycolicibacterium rutilum]SEH88686.1 PE-PPE domain-containing protein [Mycolicibacterium rutilum]
MTTAEHADARAATWRLRAAARVARSIGTSTAAVMATVVLAAVTTTPAVQLSAASTALLVCGTTCPRWHDADVDRIMNQFITPTHPNQDITPEAVTAPGQAWPLTGLMRLAGRVVGDPSFFGPGGAAWPDQPWWKLSGLFDLTTDQSIRAGVDSLEEAMAAQGDGPLVIYGYSQGAIVATAAKRRLAERYPAGTAAPDISFVLGGDFHVPNGGIYSRFPGLYIPVLDWSFNPPAPTDTEFHTDVIIRESDGVSDFPLYPLNFIADLNALLGFLYVHTYPFDVSLPEDPTTSPAYQGTHGDTSYYFFETADLPLFGPLRTLGVPEAVIDVFEPFFRVLVGLGYDRTIPPWEPTPARLLPPINPVKLAVDLVNAVGEGVNNALALAGASPQPSAPSPEPVSAPAPEEANARPAVRNSAPPRTEPPIDAESDPATSLTERKQSEKPEPELADREEESDEDGQQKGPITDADDLSADDDETGTDDESSPSPTNDSPSENDAANDDDSE